MKKLIISIAFCSFCLLSYSQDSMNKKMENKSDKMNKKMENNSDKMNKKLDNTPPDSTRGKTIEKPMDTTRNKVKIKPLKKKAVV